MGKLTKKLTALIAAFCMVLSASPVMAYSYDSKASSYSKSSGARISTQAYMAVGEGTLKSDLVKNPSSYKWTTSNKNVVAISGNYLAAKKEGTAKVTAKKSKTTYEFNITVKKQFIIATKTFTNVGTVGNFYSSCTNYYWNGTWGTGYKGGKIAFNSAFKKNLKNFVKASGARTSAKPGYVSLSSTPSKATVYCSSGNKKLAWTSAKNCKSTKATVSLIDTNGDGFADKAKITVYAYGKTDSQKGTYDTLCGTVTVNLKATNKG